MPNQINVNQPFSYRSETLTHQSRVSTDGGTIDRQRDLDQNITNQVQISQFANLIMGFGASYGYKISSGVFDKLYDYSGNNRDVTATTTTRPTYDSTGRYNMPSIGFDGSNDFLVSSAFSFPSTNAISFCCWIKSTDAASLRTVFNSSLQSNATGYIWFYRNGANITVQYRSTNSGGSNINFNSTFFVGTLFDSVWVHFAITLDFTSNIARVYRNGIQVSSTALLNPIFPSDNVAKFFGSYQGGSHFSLGGLDCIRVYSSILSPADVQRIMNEI